MKRVLTLILRLIILILLIFLGYQKTTGKIVDVSYITDPIGKAGSKVISFVKKQWQAISPFPPSTGTIPALPAPAPAPEPTPAPAPEPTLTLTGVSAEEFSGIKADLQMNQDFSQSLLQNTFVLKPQVGKWDIYVTWSGSQDNLNDQIIIAISGQSFSYPVFYNTGNSAIAAQWGSGVGWTIYASTGMIVIQSDKYYIYYPAYSTNSAQTTLEGAILALPGGVTTTTRNLIPLLFYKNQYFFTTISDYNEHQGLYVLAWGAITSLITGNIGWVTAESGFVSVYDSTIKKILVISLEDMGIKYTLPIRRDTVSYQAVLVTDTGIWTKYNDNLKNTTVYEKHMR